MTDKPRWFQTTAIDYPNSRPHIGTAFEKLGADVQARYRRMEGYDVFFLMGNDENTVKVSQARRRTGPGHAGLLRRHGPPVPRGLGRPRHQLRRLHPDQPASGTSSAAGSSSRRCTTTATSTRGSYEGWYCEGCEEFKTDKQHDENDGLCPNHKTPLIRRSEPCYFFKLSAFQDRLLKHYEENPDFIQPESRANEIVSLIKNEGLRDINITPARRGRGASAIPFDPEFTIYVWFDALLTYITGIGYGDDEATFRKYWPADIHFIGKDITRFHCALWPAMLWAAGEEAPKKVFGHGFVYVKNEETGAVEKISKSLGNVVEPMEVISKFSAEAFRYYFLRECPFPSRRRVQLGAVRGGLQLASWRTTSATCSAGDDAHRRRTTTACFDGTAGKVPEPVVPGLDLRGVRRRRCAGTSRRAGTTWRCRRSCRTSSRRPTSTWKRTPRGSW